MSEMRPSGASNELVTSNVTITSATLTSTIPEPLVSDVRPMKSESKPRAGQPRGSRRHRRRADQDQILAIYETHYRDLLRFASLTAPEPAMAEDLVHEAFVKLYGAWKRIDDPSRVGGYLRTTVLNLARGRARHLGVVRRNQPAALPDAASAESHVMVNDDRNRVVAALRGLSDRQRACLVLRHYEDQSESEIAEILGISIGSVRTHVHRGMQAMGQILDEEVRR